MKTDLLIRHILILTLLILDMGLHANLTLANLNPDPPKESLWSFGGYLDLGYLLDFNFPDNNTWRNKTTTIRVNELAPNLGLGYLRKTSAPHSPWGFDVAMQGGVDTDGLIPGPLPGSVGALSEAENLRYFSRANVSYLAPIGRGVMFTGGLFQSYIGRESFYAKDNFSYTRTYLADQSPYFLFGFSATSTITNRLDLGFYIINGFNYLAEPNNIPSYGVQVKWNPHPDFLATHNLYYGPDQVNGALKFWRFFTDNSWEWRRDRFMLALSYDFGTQVSEDSPGNPRFFWTGAAFWANWQIQGPWSVTFRPEFFWDPDGLISGGEQLLRAITTTLEYKFHVDPTQTTIIRLEFRFDESTGSGGGFFTGGEGSTGSIGLTPHQQLLIVGLMMSFDSQ